MHRILFALGLAAQLLACASPDPRTYMLEVIPGLPLPGTLLPGPVRMISVRSVQIPRYLERNEVIRQSDGGRLRIANNDWWGEPLRTMLQRVLASDLALRLGAAEVLGTDAISGARTEIVVEVQRFEPNGDGAVVLAGHYAAEVDGTRRLLKRFDVRVSYDGGGATPDQVRAMSLALGQLADLVAVELP